MIAIFTANVSEEIFDDHFENTYLVTTYLESENSAFESLYCKCLKIKVEKVNWEVVHANIWEVKNFLAG